MFVVASGDGGGGGGGGAGTAGTAGGKKFCSRVVQQ